MNPTKIHEILEMELAGMGQYAHGNQPIQHAIYLYNYAQQPWKTQEKVRYVMDNLYGEGADGYCGDEDNGQTSAWFVFSSLGFYPVAPVTGQYILGSPLFKEVEINLNNGKTSLTLLEDEYGISPGQACVFYKKDIDGDRVLGGGWITR